MIEVHPAPEVSPAPVVSPAPKVSPPPKVHGSEHRFTAENHPYRVRDQKIAALEKELAAAHAKITSIGARLPLDPAKATWHILCANHHVCAYGKGATPAGRMLDDIDFFQPSRRVPLPKGYVGPPVCVECGALVPTQDGQVMAKYVRRGPPPLQSEEAPRNEGD